jgi:anti-sigma regulatory factor (Ser/Thr protein kinase)
MPAAVATAEARSFPATPDSIVEMDGWIEGIGARWEIDDRVLFRARVCVGELAANLLEHGKPAADGAIDLVLRHKPPGLEIELSDSGAAFDPAAAPEIESESDRIGGRGLRLVRSYAQSIVYRRAKDRNIIVLRLAPLSG